jgi:hypothetical protein
LSRWAEKGVLERVFAALVGEGLLVARVCGLDSTPVKPHLDAHGTGKNGPSAIGKILGGWNRKIHIITVGDTGMVAFRLFGGNIPDAAEGRWLRENGIIRLIS